MNKQDFEEVKEKFEAETKRRKRISLTLNYLSTIAAGLALAVFVSKYFVTDFSSDFANSVATSVKTDDLENEILSLKSELKLQRKIADSLRQQQSAKNVEPTQVQKLQAEVENLNRVILENPEKAISVPLLRADIEHLKEQNQNDVKVLREEIAKSYDTNKWIIGLVCTMLVSIIALNISNLLAKKKD